MLQCVGEPVHKAITGTMALGLGAQQEAHPDMAEFIATMLGSTPRSMQSVTVEAERMGLHRHTFQSRVIELAACVHFGHQVYLSSLFSSLAAQIQLGHIRPIAAGRMVSQDETTMSMRGQKWSGAVEGPAPLKLLQTKASLQFVFEVISAGSEPRPLKLMLWTAKVPCPLQTVDHTTGETIHSAITTTFDLPLYQQVVLGQVGHRGGGFLLILGGLGCVVSGFECARLS